MVLFFEICGYILTIFCMDNIKSAGQISAAFNLDYIHKRFMLK